jgi:adenylate kinase
MSHLIIFGPPGSGKGTQAENLAKLLKAKHLSIGDVLRDAIKKNHPLSKDFKEAMLKGNLVDDKIINKIVEDEINENKENVFVFDGYPRNLNQANFLDKLISPKNLLVLQLVVSTDELLKRLSSRQRDDDDSENIARRLKVYEDTTKILINYYKETSRLKEIKGEGDIKDIFNRLKKAIN